MSISLISLEELSERLIYIRRITGYSQAKLAEMGGTTQQAIQQAEKGKAKNPRYLAQLANALEVPQEWLALNIMPEEISPRGLSEEDTKFINEFAHMTEKQKKFLKDTAKSMTKDETSSKKKK